MRAQLPVFLKCKTARDLIRVGRDNDGGYLISSSDVDASDILLSLGINDDWSFEEDFCKKNRVPLLAYDGSVGKLVFLRNLVASLVRFDHPWGPFHWVKTFFSYMSFFRGERRHIKKYVGLKWGELYVSFQDVISSIDSERIFMKVDIEGFEYRILDELVRYQDRITGLAIEFHDCDLHMDRICEFVEALSLPLVHVHANNGAPLTAEGGIPLAIELTFSKFAKDLGGCVVPNTLDMPNNRFRKEIELEFN